MTEEGLFTIYIKNPSGSNCANGTQKFRLENPVRSTRFPFPVRSDKTEIYRKGPEARGKTQQNVNGTK